MTLRGGPSDTCRTPQPVSPKQLDPAAVPGLTLEDSDALRTRRLDPEIPICPKVWLFLTDCEK